MTDEAIWNKQVGSDSRMNNMTNIKNTGTYLAALDKTKYGLFICTADGSGLTKDHVYLCNAAGDALIDLTIVSNHTHTSTAGQGGAINDVFIGNAKVIDLLLTKTTDLQKANWIQTNTGTATIEDKTDGTTGERSIRLRPNGTSGSGSTISYPHLKLDFSQHFLYQTKLQIETASSIALHTGIGADDITAADSSTRKTQAEVCTTVNNNWWLRTANGSSVGTGSDTGIAISANRVAIKIIHLVTETDLQVDTGTLLQKSSNIPTDSATADINLIKHSVKNSTGADRPLLHYGSRLVYTVSDNWV